jgi:class 3 adenylate cyclase
VDLSTDQGGPSCAVVARTRTAEDPGVGQVPRIRYMTGERPQLTVRSLDHPDADRPLGRGSGGYVDLGSGLVIGRAVLEPGWRWSEDVKSVVGTPSCQIHHLQLILSGRLGVRMDGGEEAEVGPHEVVDIPSGHDAWVIGDEPLVLLDVFGHSAEFAQPAAHARAVVTMLMTDIVDSTKLAGQLGDAAWKQRLAEHNQIVRRHLAQNDGREVDTTGDGFLAAFNSAAAALRAALAIRDAVRSAGVEIRAGVHTGEVDIVEGGDLRGIAVHEAARIMAAAGAGTVYTSGLTRTLASASGLAFESVGVHALKGFETPAELFAVRDGT